MGIAAFIVFLVVARPDNQPEKPESAVSSEEVGAQIDAILAQPPELARPRKR